MTSESNCHKGGFRPLSADEIARLTDQGCGCEDWSNVRVAKDFDAGRVRATCFWGEVKLGVFEKQVSFAGGVTRPSGISNATIHNCTIGNNVCINQIGGYIANYIIEDGVVIENVDLLVVEGPSSFGNGTEAGVVNEGGGREIPIYDRLSAHTAYVIALYRHRPKATEKLVKMIAAYTESVTSAMGHIGADAKLINCRIIKNVKVGPASVIEGATRLENGSINSCPDDPAYIGPGVLAKDFICCSGSEVTDGAMISRCFVGQGTILAKQYSAEDSVFFANCEGFHGEACAIFAGPYTVTHHKSTLLIAGLFSFYNAGSGTNQSNHMYKLGPVHQGVIERGSKTGSDSYMLWPAKIGAFSVVVGKHYSRPDTSDFPFSYLTEHNGESILAPGTNLRKVGVVRDAKKWPVRDRRKGREKLDLINFELLSAYAMQKALRGHQLLVDHEAGSDDKPDCFICPGVKIRGTAVKTGVQLYQAAIDNFLGNCVIERLENKSLESVEELRAVLLPESNAGAGKWVDLAGLFAPEEAVQKTLGDIEDGTIRTLEQVTEAFQSMHDNTRAYEWAWAADVLGRRLNKELDKVTAADLIGLAMKWKKAVEKFGRLWLADAEKEYTAAVRVGYGLDGDEEIGDADFEAVRGTFEKNSFVCEVKESTSQDIRRADELIARLSKLK